VLVMRLPGRWLLLGLCTVVAGVGIGLAFSGAPLPWSSGGRALPPTRARVYENVDACLLTGSSGLNDPATAQVWAGMEDASKSTTARVSYLAATGQQTPAGAAPYAGSLLVSGCKVVVASGSAERAAALAEAPKFSTVRFVVTGPAAGSPPNVTTLTFTTTGLRPAIASAVTAGIHSAGG
jgi:basic membrane lipoprotein Med (substrate-binding protein (PBP1-ABC) superfamily)